jgi:hypothetical protein
MATYPRGFVPVRSLGSSLGGGTRRYRTRAKNGVPIFVGDVVVAVSAATGLAVTPFVAATDGTVAAGGVLGVVQSVYDSNKKPYVFAQPTRGPYIPASTDGYVDVIIDPNQTYIACVNGTASGGMAGQYGVIDTTVAGTAYGISPMMVGVATTTNNIRTPVTGDQTPIAGNWPLHIIQVIPFENTVDHDNLENSYEGVDGGKVEVRLCHNVFGGVANAAKRIVS